MQILCEVLVQNVREEFKFTVDTYVRMIIVLLPNKALIFDYYMRKDILFCVYVNDYKVVHNYIFYEISYYQRVI